MAGVTFNADEVFAIALEIERNGARFYRKAAGFAKDADAKVLLETLASMEDKHYEIFSEMKKKLAGADRSETVWDPAGEAQAYLSAMADRRVFDLSDPSLALSGKESMEAVFKKAISLEKDSVVFYVGMKELVPAKLGGDKIDGVIHEEMNHITILTREMRAA